MAETMYGTQDGDSQSVMSERVQSLASSIYQEFERMLKRYDEDVVKELMPLVVGILENLDQAYQEKQETDVELELLRDDNEQLLTQYEREKQLRKGSEQKALELEDATEEERKLLQGQTENLESGVRMLELKGKNAQDHISRLEDKESEMKKEYSKLHERYTDLFKTHMDYMERTKLVMGGDRICEMGASPRTRGGFHMPHLKSVNPNIYQSGDTPVSPDKGFPGDGSSITSPGSQTSNVSLKNELKDIDNAVETAEKEQNTDCVVVTTQSTGTKTSPKQSQNVSTIKEDETKINKTNTVTIPSRTLSSSSSAGTDEKSSSDAKIINTNTETSDKEDIVHKNKDANNFDDEQQIDLQISDIVGDASFEEDNYGDMISPDVEVDDNAFGPTKSTPIDANKRASDNITSIYDEFSMHGMDAIGEVDDGVDITGMSKEVENLILENTELLATKNALNVVKDDLISKVDELTSEQEILKEEITSLQAMREKLKTRVAELEGDMKKMKEELEKVKEKQAGGQEGEEGADGEIPMAQRKRFTRVEMARVLMERNQYKERLMELQEAVRWTEMIRASKEHPDVVPASKKKGSIWNFFSNLFSSDKPKNRRAIATPTLHYTSPTSVRPVGDPNKKHRDNYNLGEKSRAYDFLQDDLLTEKSRKEREKERREQYKQVRAHVKKDDGRMQAYGWSLPSKMTPSASNKDLSGNSKSITKGSGKTSKVPVPVPVYCRPLIEMDDTLKIWCAAGVTLTGGKTKDGGSIVGASVFYSDTSIMETTTEDVTETEIEKLNKELKEHEKDLKTGEDEQDKMSSLVWICTTTHNQSQVSVIDANNPGEVLENFRVSTSHVLCIASVPGALESDFEYDDSDIICTDSNTDDQVEIDDQSTTATTADEESSEQEKTTDVKNEQITDQGIGGITFVQCITGSTSPIPDDETKVDETPENTDPLGASPEVETLTVIKAKGSPVKSGDITPTQPEGKNLPGQGTDNRETLIKDGIGEVGLNIMTEEMNKLSSLLPTMWIGTQSGSLYVHSVVSNWKKCLHSVKLKDSVLSIVHVKGRVFVALADGSVAVFRRNKENQWDLSNYHLIDLGKPHHSVRCLCVIANKHVWCGYKNKVHIIDPKSLKLEKSFDAHPRKESQVRQLSWTGDGVWVSIRLDSTLRLYHAYTHQHLQDVDIEPYVSKMLGTGKLGFSFVRITSLLISCNRLWIGTGNGVIISVPLSDTNKQAVTVSMAGRPGGVVRVYNDNKSDSVTPATFIPYCSMAQAQLSFHGHRDAVKFFAAVPGIPSHGVSGVVSSKKDEKSDGEKDNSSNYKNMLVLSGGEGYIDFRLGDPEDECDNPEDEEQGNSNTESAIEKKTSISKGDRSHLIVWQVFQPK